MERLLRHQKYWNASNRSSWDFWYLLYLWNIVCFLDRSMFRDFISPYNYCILKISSYSRKFLWSFPLSKIHYKISHSPTTLFPLSWVFQTQHELPLLSKKIYLLNKTWTDTLKCQKYDWQFDYKFIDDLIQKSI